MRFGEQAKLQSAINVTPLVDVVLVLLIIFMVVAPHMRKGPGPEVDMPATAKPQEQRAEGGRVLVTIDEHGELWIDDQPVAADRLGEGLQAATADEPESKIVIKGDARLPFGEVRRTMLRIEEAGFHGVGLIAERIGTETHGG
jgi:biopolymer transport protein ExbD/biopolymer transport protein TolR